MLDIRLIREKPDFVRERLAMRGSGDEAKIDEVLRIDSDRRKSETDLQRSQSERNRLSKEIGARRSRKEPSEELEAEVRKIGEQIAGLTQRTQALDEEQRVVSMFDRKTHSSRQIATRLDLPQPLVREFLERARPHVAPKKPELPAETVAAIIELHEVTAVFG